MRAVLFDLDDTLYDRDATVRTVFESQRAAFATELGAIDRDRFVARGMELDDHGMGDKAVVYRILGAELGLAESLAERLLADFWERYFEECRPSEDTLATLATLRARGFKIGMITNGGGETQRRKIASLGIEDAFDVILISEIEGIRKPDPVIFQRALERLGVTADQAIFVGDNPVADIGGALAVGLRPVWKRSYRPPTGFDVMHVDRLSEILPLCPPVE